MRILYSHYLSDDTHPAARMVDSIATELTELGHEVLVHRSAPWVNRAKVAGAATRRGLIRRSLWFMKELGRNRPAYTRDAAVLATFRPDVVLCRQDAYRYSMALACRHADVPLVTYADAPVAYESRHFNGGARWHPPGLLERIERWVLQQSRAIVTVSEPAARVLGAYGLRNPIVAAPNGVDTNRFRPTTLGEWTATRNRLGITTPLVAGFVGSFRPFHGLALLREMISRTSARTDLTWVLVGDGDGRGGLQAAVRSNPRVIFCGRQPSDLVPSLLGSMDVLVAPYQRELSEFYFCPLKVLEAMAAGVPCLTSDLGDIPGLLRNGGMTVSSEDPRVWVEKLSFMLDQPGLRAAMGVVARARVEQEFTWAQTARRVADVLSGVAKPRRCLSW